MTNASIKAIYFLMLKDIKLIYNGFGATLDVQDRQVGAKIVAKILFDKALHSYEDLLDIDQKEIAGAIVRDLSCTTFVKKNRRNK